MRTLVAALACRLAGSRLYGKPMQLLDVDGGVSVLDHMIAMLATETGIARTVLGVAEGPGNEVFLDVAQRHGIGAIRGSERDVLRRLIQCGEAGGGTDVFRVTTESPFTHMDMVAEVWQAHLTHDNDVTVIDGLPEGCHFEIYTLDTLRRSHERGDERHRSELCSLYVREHRDEFQVEVVPVPAALERLDLRLTIDWPEDLVVCRRVYDALRSYAPRIPVPRIIEYLDAEPEMRRLVAPYVQPVRLY